MTAVIQNIKNVLTEDVALGEILRETSNYLYLHSIAEDFVEEGGVDILYCILKRQAKKKKTKISKYVVLGALRSILRIHGHCSLLTRININIDQDVYSIILDLTFKDTINTDIVDVIHFLSILIEMQPYNFRVFHKAVINSSKSKNLIPYFQFLQSLADPSPRLKRKTLLFLDVTMRRSQIDLKLLKELIVFWKTADIQKTLKTIEPFFSSETDHAVFTAFKQTFHAMKDLFFRQNEMASASDKTIHVIINKTIQVIKRTEEKETIKLKIAIDSQRDKVRKIRCKLEIGSSPEEMDTMHNFHKKENAKIGRLQLALMAIRNDLVSTAFQFSRDVILLIGVKAVIKKKFKKYCPEEAIKRLAKTAISKILKHIREGQIRFKNFVSKEIIIRELLYIVGRWLSGTAKRRAEQLSFMTGLKRRQIERRRRCQFRESVECEEVFSDGETSTITMTPSSRSLTPFMITLSPLSLSPLDLPLSDSSSSDFSPRSMQPLSPLNLSVSLSLSEGGSRLSTPKFRFDAQDKKQPIQVNAWKGAEEPLPRKRRLSERTSASPFVVLSPLSLQPPAPLNGFVSQLSLSERVSRLSTPKFINAFERLNAQDKKQPIQDTEEPLLRRRKLCEKSSMTLVLHSQSPLNCPLSPLALDEKLSHLSTPKFIHAFTEVQKTLNKKQPTQVNFRKDTKNSHQYAPFLWEEFIPKRSVLQPNVKERITKVDTELQYDSPPGVCNGFKQKQRLFTELKNDVKERRTPSITPKNTIYTSVRGDTKDENHYPHWRYIKSLSESRSVSKQVGQHTEGKNEHHSLFGRNLKRNSNAFSEIANTFSGTPTHNCFVK